VVPGMFGHGAAYVLQNPDGRVVFAIPFERDFTLIGTTDEDFAGEVEAAAASPQEIAYLCDAVNRYFRVGVTGADVVWAFAGVRPLHDNSSRRAQDVTRDYVLMLDGGARQAPLLSIYGGKITTYRRLAERALDKLKDYFNLPPAWTAQAPLPGGDLGGERPEALAERIGRSYPFVSARLAGRLAAAYGSRAHDILRGAACLDDLGMRFGAELTAAEVGYLMRVEWAQTADDVLWRRSKLGLRLPGAQREALARYMADATGKSWRAPGWYGK